MAPEWVAAAIAACVTGSEEEVAETVFYALVAMMHSPDWLAAQPVDSDDFPPVPLPGDGTLAAVATLGRRIAELTDPTVDVPGVTSVAIDPSLASIGVADGAVGSPMREFGSVGAAGGKRDGDSVLWAGTSGWRGIPDEVWQFKACGHAVLPKWLSYRVRRPLTSAARRDFMHLCRRVATIQQLEADCDRYFKGAQLAPLTTEP